VRTRSCPDSRELGNEMLRWRLGYQFELMRRGSKRSCCEVGRSSLAVMGLYCALALRIVMWLQFHPTCQRG
jgi:hypothetical protein